jgi:thiol-disulfide isomerase/thioredoxin
MAVVNVNDNEFLNTIQQNEKVMVKYYADWCGSCKLFAPKYKRLSNDELNEGVVFLEVNAEENEQARKLANVDNLPFLASFKNGVLLEGSATSKEEYALKMLENLKN